MKCPKTFFFVKVMKDQQISGFCNEIKAFEAFRTNDVFLLIHFFYKMLGNSMNREMSSQRSLETLPGILGIHFLQCQRGKCRENSVSSKVKRIELNLSYHYPSETTILVAQGAIVRYSPACNLQTVRLYIKSHETPKKIL